MKGDVRIPATEVEIADAVQWAGNPDRLIIRKLAFERDMLKAAIERYQKILVNQLADALINQWDDWEAEAGQAAQQDQDDRSFRHVMRTKIVSCVWKDFGWPMEDANA